MTKTARLTDIQLILLTTAAACDNGSLLPSPSTLGDSHSRINKAVAGLIRRTLAKEVDATPGVDTWRTHGDHKIGVVITDAGRAAIGIDITPESPEAPESLSASENTLQADATADLPNPPPTAARTKTALVLQMLTRETGATLDELIAATSWLPHTTRAALTGLRKKGHGIDRRKRGEVTCYHLAQA
jgi:hypothetical protein